MNVDSQEMQQVLTRLNQIEAGFKEDFHRLEDRFNDLAAEGLPKQVASLHGRVDILSQRMWMLAVGWVFTLAGWAWSLSR